MEIKYKIKEVKPNVFAVIVKDKYDRAMLFCRAQEYYESPNKKFRGKDFSIWDYMKWYASNHTGFSYAGDWSGFNIPFLTMWKCYNTLSDLPDWETPYDGYMWEILVAISNKMDITKKAYVIGAGDTDGWTFQHEVCHGLWYTNASYKKEAKNVLRTIDPNDYQIFKQNLLDMGYTDKVIDDEIHAYLCYGHDSENFCKGVDIDKCDRYHKAFLITLENFLK
jgi:hypothetical protein